MNLWSLWSVRPFETSKEFNISKIAQPNQVHLCCSQHCFFFNSFQLTKFIFEFGNNKKERCKYPNYFLRNFLQRIRALVQSCSCIRFPWCGDVVRGRWKKKKKSNFARKTKNQKFIERGVYGEDERNRIGSNFGKAWGHSWTSAIKDERKTKKDKKSNLKKNT